LFSILFLAAQASENSLFGHRAYPEAPSSALVLAGIYRKDRKVKLRAPAAQAFKNMAAAAQKDGIRLTPISGFRSVSYQEGLWKRAVKRHGSAQTASRWVAPPGYSEHATGWTLDVGDLDRPACDVETCFEETPAFRWLNSNATAHGFELSFPKDNPQGVSYEPWHWRYVGAPAARTLFHAE
jgi:LAS superfamily LD-carboxypeptidase LdcB